MSTHELSLFDSVAATAAQMPAVAFTEPDDDWVPVLFMEDSEGNQATMPIEMFMQNEQTKNLLTDMIIPAAIKNFKARTVVMVLSVWRSTLPPDVDWQDRPTPSEDLDRREEVMIIEYTAEGVTRSAMAEIIRHENAPPTLAEWDDMGEASLSQEGRFVGPIVAAMKRVS